MNCPRRAMRNCYTIVSHKHTKKHLWTQNKRSIENRRNSLKTSALKTGWNVITVKDHKENFRNNIKCRLINPSKSEVGLVSKCYLSNIIADVSRKTKVNKWKNTSMVIDWFKNLADKQEVYQIWHSWILPIHFRRPTKEID